MNRKEAILMVVVLLLTFIGGVFASQNVPAIQQVFVTNFPKNQNSTVTNLPKDSNGNVKVTVQNPNPVNITVQPTLPAKQIVIFNGDLLGFGYRVNQTTTYAGTTGTTLILNRTYYNPTSYYYGITQHFKVTLNTTAVSITFSVTGPPYYSAPFTFNPNALVFPFSTTFQANQGPSLTNAVFTFNILTVNPVTIKIELLATSSDGQTNNIPELPFATLGVINATGFRNLTIHSSYDTTKTLLVTNSGAVLPFLFDPFTQTQFLMNPVNLPNNSCGAAVFNSQTCDIQPPSIIRVDFAGTGDFYGLKIVAYLWN